MKPRFSIVIPTRNRDEWLAKSAAAALAQDFPSFEVVVVDNSTPGSSATEKVVRDFNSPKLRYIRTGGLGMPENWQVAVESAAGEYFLICSDKLMLAPGLLSLLDRNLRESSARIVVWNLGRQNQIRPVGDLTIRGRLVPGGEIWECATSGAWRIFQNAGARGMNSAIDRTLVPEVENRLGVPFCRPGTPDYTMAMTLAAMGVDSLYLDIIGSGFLSDAHGTGLLALMAPDDQTVRKKFDVPMVSDLPVKFATGTNLIYQDICSLNKLLPDALKRPLNWEMYFVHLIHEAANADQMGGFGAVRKQELLSVICLQPLRFRLSLAKTVINQEWQNLLRRKYKISFQLKLIMRLMKYIIPPLFIGRKMVGPAAP